MKKTWIIGISITLLVVILIFTKGFGLFNSTINNNDKNNGEIKISLSEVSEKAEWYEYVSNDVITKFFVVKADDGSIKTGFDACDVCYRNKKGYRQEGKYMICNNCGNKYPINGLGTQNKNPGGCWPGYLPNTLKGETLIIKNSDLEKGRWRFI